MRFCNIKFQLINFHNPKYVTKKFPYPKNISTINTPSQNQINTPPKCHHYQIYHIFIQPPNFAIAMQKENFYMSMKKFPQLHAQMNSHIPNKNFPQYPKKLPITLNISMHIPTKVCHVHKTKFTHANKFSHIYHERIPISQAQSFHDANTPKVQTKIHPTTSQITYIVKIPKSTNIAQIAPRSKKKHTSRMLQSQHSKHDQSHNAPKISKVIISHCEIFNETCNNILPSKETKEKTHIGVYMTIWSMGPRVLKKSIITMPLKCWIILLTMRS